MFIGFTVRFMGFRDKRVSGLYSLEFRVSGTERNSIRGMYTGLNSYQCSKFIV